MLQEDRSRMRCYQSALLTLEHSTAQLKLQVANTFVHRRRQHVERPGRPAEGAMKVNSQGRFKVRAFNASPNRQGIERGDIRLSRDNLPHDPQFRICARRRGGRRQCAGHSRLAVGARTDHALL